MEFAYDGGGLGKGGEVTLFIDGAPSGKGRVDATLAMVFSADDGCDVGIDMARPFPRTTARVATRSTAWSRACNWRSTLTRSCPIIS